MLEGALQPIHAREFTKKTDAAANAKESTIVNSEYGRVESTAPATHSSSDANVNSVMVGRGATATAARLNRTRKMS